MPRQSRPRRHPDASSQCLGNIAAFTRCAWPVGAGSFGRECSSRCGAGSGISACRAIEGVALVSGSGWELFWIENLDALPAGIASLIEEDLALRDFMPRILRLVAVSTFAHAKQLAGRDRPWGDLVRAQGGEDIRRVDASRLVITDRHGIQYQIEDQQALDAISRKLLDRFL